MSSKRRAYIDRHRGTWTGPADVPLTKRLSFQGVVNGIVPATAQRKTAQPQTANIQVPVGSIKKDAAFDIGAGHEWIGSQPQKPIVHKKATENIDADNILLAKDYTTYLVAQYDGYFGSKDNCTFNYQRTMSRYRIDRPATIERDPSLAHGPLNGKALWYDPDRTRAKKPSSTLKPLPEANKHFVNDLSRMSINSSSRKSWSPILGAILDEFANSSDILRAWIEGVTEADEVNRAIRNGQPELIVPRCERDHGVSHAHPCCRCSAALPREEIEYDDTEQDYICEECARDEAIGPHLGKHKK